MATNFIPTGSTFSNLTRRELEQLRKADFSAGGKALTVGDATNAGSINDERFYTGPVVSSSDVWPIPPPSTPGPFLLSSAQTSNFAAESVRWFGPQFITSGNTGYSPDGLNWYDSSADTYFVNVQVGDILLIKSRSSGTNGNANATCIVNGKSTTGVGPYPTSVLSLSLIQAPNAADPETLDVGSISDVYSYMVIRQAAVQLFAVPGSGPVGQEQTFLTVVPTSTLHSNVGPTLDEINFDRVISLVPPSFAGSEAIDRADAIFQPPAGPGSTIDLVGYRPILYRSLPDGSGPDFNSPIPKNPRIDGYIPDSDQRMTVDFKAGIFRFSTPPVSGFDVKPTGGTGGVNATTGRLQLWVVFWAADTSLTQGASTSVYLPRSSVNSYASPGRVRLDSSGSFIRVGSTSSGNDLVVRALDLSDQSSTDSSTDLLTDFGASIPGSYYSFYNFRGFRIRNSDGYLRMIQAAVPGDPLPPPETRIEEKSRITVGQYTHPVGDFNLSKTSTSTGMALRDASIDIQAALNEALLGDEYHVVHLRKGVYRNESDIFLPPGVTLEGEGQGTIIDTYKSSIRVGPNTKWGTYDPTAITTSGHTDVVPTLFPLPESFKVEGYDIVWNKSRRVWGVFIAESISNSIWFNEMNLDGTTVFPGVGINVKTSTGKFFTTGSANSTYLTVGHYPRVVHNPNTDDYIFVWTEEFAGTAGTGPKSYFSVLRYVTSSIGSSLHSRYQIIRANVVITGYQYTAHPSVAVAPVDSSSNYPIAINCWTYSDQSFVTSGVYTVVYSSSGVYASQIVSRSSGFNCTSTDVTLVNTPDPTSFTSKFIFAWSERLHTPISGWYSIGSFDGSGNFTDVTYPNWSTAGVQVGDRFLLTVQGATNLGYTGVVQSISGGSLTVQFEGAEGSQTTQIINQSGLTYMIMPVSRIYCRAFTGPSFYSVVKVAGPDVSPNISQYHFQEREPDFVRLSSASEDRTIIVYQNFDTRASLSRPLVQNFDNGKNSSYLDYLGTTSVTGNPVRVHLSTSYVIVSHSQLALSGSQVTVSPSSTDGYESAESSVTELRRSNDIEVIHRSLGSRDPLDVFANTQNNVNHPYDEVSLRNYSLPVDIVAGTTASFIPDVSWNGTDWVIVSPTVDKISSNSGILTYTSGTQYLSDFTFLFSVDSGDPQGRTYRRTLITGDQIFFPTISGGTYRTVTSVLSEHVVALNSPILGGLSSSGYSWVLVRGSGNRDSSAYAKSPGFRVGLDGRVIVSSSYTTFADEISDISSERPKQEVLERGLFGNTIFNQIQANYLSASSIPSKSGLNHILTDSSSTPLNTPGLRVLLIGQGDFTNGLWVVGDGAWTRAPEMEVGMHISGMHVYIISGDFAGVIAYDSDSYPNDLVGTSTLTFTNIPTPNAFSELKYGQKGVVWNDLVEGSRLEGDIGFRGLTIGAPRRSDSGTTNPTENYLVALSCGDNLFGFLDRERVDGQPVNIRAFRQSIGPFNSEIKDLTVRSRIDVGELVPEVFNRVYTRHGGSGCSNPFFATDGYRNVFLHLGVWSYGQTWSGGVLNDPLLVNKDPRLPGGYTTSLCAVFSDITGKYSVRKRVITFPNISRFQPQLQGLSTDYNQGIPEWQRNFLIGVLPQDLLSSSYPDGVRKPSYGARAIWTGKTFLGLMIVPRGILLFDLGSSEEDTNLDESLVGGTVVRDASTYKVYELPSIQGFAYINNGCDGPLPGPVQNIQQFPQNLLLDPIIAKGDARAIDVADVLEVDTCWVDGTLAVVWIAGVNACSPSVSLIEMGQPILGVTLFRRGQGGSGGNQPLYHPASTTSGRNDVAFNSTSYILDTTAFYGYVINANGSIRDPKIVWNGDSFTVTYLYQWLDNSFTPRTELKTISFPKDGLRSNLQILAVSSQFNNEVQVNGPPGNTIPSGVSIGQITASGCFHPSNNIVLKPGDIVLITRTCTAIDNSTNTIDTVSGNPNSSNLSGAYTVLHFDPYGSGLGPEVNLGINLLRPGVRVSDQVFGMILSGDGVSPNAQGDNLSNLVVGSGTVRSGLSTLTNYGVSTVFGGNDMSSIWASFYVPSQDKFVVFYNRGSYFGATSYTRNGVRVAEVKLALTPSADSATHISVGWNGTYFLVSAVLSGGSTVDYWMVSSDLGVMGSGTLTTLSTLVGNSRSQVPGPGYGAPSQALSPGYAIRATSVVWNTKLCKWQISVSLGWWAETSDRARYNSLSLATLNTDGVTSYSGRTLTVGSSSTVFRQPGIRLLGAMYYSYTAGITSGSTLTGIDYLNIQSPPPDSSTVVLGIGPSLNYTTPLNLTLNTSVSGTDTSLQVIHNDATPQGEFYMYVNNTAGELIRVDTVSFGSPYDTFTVERGALGTTANPIATTDTLVTYPFLSGNRGYVGGSYLASLSGGDFRNFRRGDLVQLPSYDATGGSVLVHITQDGFQYSWPGSGAINYLTFEGAIYPLSNFISSPWPGSAGVNVYRISKEFIFTTISSNGTNQVRVSTDSSEVRNQPSSYSNYNFFAIPREDVFLFTLGDTHPLVEVKDADGVYIENVQLQGGNVDISESYPRMSRPFWKTGGVVYGMTGTSVSTGKMGQKPHVAPVTATPLGKVDTLRYSNIRSKSRGRYDQDPIMSSTRKGV